MIARLWVQVPKINNFGLALSDAVANAAISVDLEATQVFTMIHLFHHYFRSRFITMTKMLCQDSLQLTVQLMEHGIKKHGFTPKFTSQKMLSVHVSPLKILN